MRTERLQRIRQQRLLRLNQLIGDTYGGKVKAFAAAMEFKGEQVSRWRSGKQGISEESARHIEDAHKLPLFWCDLPDSDLPAVIQTQEPKAVYHIPSPQSEFDPIIRATARLMAELDLSSRRLVHDLAHNLHSRHNPNGTKKLG